MKILLLTAAALVVVCTVGLSPAVANRFGPFDTRLTDDSDALGQNGLNAATTTPDGRHDEWQYHYGHEWEALGPRQVKRRINGPASRSTAPAGPIGTQNRMALIATVPIR